MLLWSANGNAKYYLDQTWDLILLSKTRLKKKNIYLKLCRGKHVHLFHKYDWEFYQQKLKYDISERSALQTEYGIIAIWVW